MDGGKPMITKAKSLCLLAVLFCVLLPLAAWAEEAADPTVPPTQPLRSARIRAVGDVMAHDHQLKIAKQKDGSYDFHPQLSLIADALGNADYTIANLETTIGKCRGQGYSGYPSFNSPRALLDALKDAGVDFLTLANNHMLDRRLEGVLNTVGYVEAYGFDHGGANRSLEEKARPVIAEVNGIRIGFICETRYTNSQENYLKLEDREYAINYLRAGEFQEDLQRLKDENVDVIIAIPHWGEEYMRKPDQKTQQIARAMIAMGVDVILGSHPHVAQPIQMLTVKGEDGQERTGLVAYSMGNFLSNQNWRYANASLMVDFTLQEKQDGGFEVKNVGVIPLYICNTTKMVCTVSAQKYLEHPHEAMDAKTVKDMKQAYGDLRKLIDERVPFLAE